MSEPAPSAPRSSPPPREPSRLERLIEEYGPFALATYLVIWLGTWAGFTVLMPFRSEGGLGLAGAIGAGWVATKATQPVRIAATLVLSPFVARVFRRVKRPPTDAPPPAA